MSKATKTKSSCDEQRLFMWTAQILDQSDTRFKELTCGVLCKLHQK